MAKKIIISFFDQPLTEPAFSYQIEIKGYPFFYNNGQDLAQVNYVPNGSPLVTESDVERGTNLNETINNTISYLSLKYQHLILSYSRVGDTIEVYINSSDYVNVIYNSYISSINITVVQPSNSDNKGLKYYFQYINEANDEYECRIFKKEYTGDSIEIYGKAIIEKASIKNHLDPIRGTGISLELEAGLNLNFEDLYTENERDFTVKLYKNGVVVFRGYLDPQGIYQSFVRDTWILSISCVDGLGSLENMSFVNEDGFHFVGKMKAIDIIYNCLKRTGILLPINTCINTYYTGLTPSDDLDILQQIELNTNRYIRVDDQTIMSCEEVLKSILDLFKACITQENAEWYIYKPNEIYSNQYAVFRRYNTDNVYSGNVTLNLNYSLGSQINGFYPHHCNSDQKIEIKAAISSARVNYKYGYVVGIMYNTKFEHNYGIMQYDGWNIISAYYSSNYIVNDPTSNVGLIIKDSISFFTPNVISDPIGVTINDLLSLKISSVSTLRNGSYGGKTLTMQIKQGIYYLKYAPKNNQSPISDAAELAVWTTNSADRYRLNIYGNFDIKVSLPKILSDGNITVAIISIEPALTEGGRTVIKEIDLVPTVDSYSEIGEIHTSYRDNNVSSKVEDNNVIYNGDNAGTVYLGAIFKNDGLTPTTTWFRRGRNESFPILRISSEEILRISQKPTKIFTGSVYGYIPYLSVTSIDNIVGKFSPIEYEFDTFRNICRVKYLELFSAEVYDILYNFTPDYGNTVKPTIR